MNGVTKEGLYIKMSDMDTLGCSYPNKQRIFAVAVKQGRVIATAINQRRHVKMLSYFGDSLHAEAHILHIMNKRMPEQDFDLYLYRKGADDIFMDVAPCCLCKSLLVQSNLRRLVFFKDGQIQVVKRKDLSVPFSSSPYFATTRYIKNMGCILQCKYS